MSDAPPDDLPDARAAAALLGPGERLMWFWRPAMAGDGYPAWVWPAATSLLLVALGGTAAWALLNEPDLPPRLARASWAALAFVAVVGVPFALRLGGQHRSADGVDAMLGGEAGPAVAYALTQRRLLFLARTRAAEVPLEPGEPVIQYGQLRINRPDRRGRPLIRHIPRDEQHRLFAAALQRARAIREGREVSA